MKAGSGRATGTAADRLSGGAGNDTLLGGKVKDVLIGDAGADRFVFASAKDTVVGSKRDVVVFSRAEGDRIDLSAIDASTRASGDQSFTWTGSGTFSKVAGQLTFSGGLLRGDTNGDGKADFEINIRGALGAADIIL